jgi:hypothetical protein
MHGYACALTAARYLGNQAAHLRTEGCPKIFREKVSGVTAERPDLKKLMAKLDVGYVVTIADVDHLSRDTTDLLVIARDMRHAGSGMPFTPNELSILRPTSRNWCLSFWGLQPNSNPAALWSAPRAAGPTQRPRA